MRLLDSIALQQSSVVANGAMNRERQLQGVNSYARELRFDLLAFVRHRASDKAVVWADLCCGTGKALIDAARDLTDAERSTVKIEGVDLAGMFEQNPYAEMVVLRELSLEAWAPSGPYALVTCVHGTPLRRR
jgi:hypothetical protein